MYRDLRRVHRSSRLYHKRWFVEEDKRITAMKNNVPKTKEKTNAEYAIPVAAQEESDAWPKDRQANKHTC